MTTTANSFMSIEPDFKNLFVPFFAVVLVAVHAITNRECESNAYPG